MVTTSNLSHRPKPHLQAEHSFRDAAVTFAVDVSGSTAGLTLQAEKQFIRDITPLLSPRSQVEAAIIPWDDKVGKLRTLGSIDTLASRGATSPAVILRNNQALQQLKISSLWFLCTDGQIPDTALNRFAYELCTKGVHGLTCVTVIFGSTRKCSPIDCNISVGVSVYASVPDCLFLYYDEEVYGNNTDGIYILSAKGTFKTLLGSNVCPVIDRNTSWASLPKVQLDKLAALILPAIKNLSENEIALEGNQVINFEDLWSNKLSPEVVSNILSNDEKISSIVMTAQSRNQTGKFQNWIQQQAIEVKDPVKDPRIDLGGKAELLYREAIGILQAGRLPHPSLQSQLRSAYAFNMAYFLREREQRESQATQRYDVINSAQMQSMTPLSSPTSFTPTSEYSTRSAPPQLFQGAPLTRLPPSGAYQPYAVSRSSTGSYEPPSSSPQATSIEFSSYQMSYPMAPPYAPNPYTPAQPVSAPAPPRAPSKRPRQHHPELLYTPGFKRARGSFTGSCSVCGSQSETLAWIFNEVPSDSSTPNFPNVMESSTPTFPLALGNFPETDVLSADICCDTCSWFATQTKLSPSGLVVKGALPMVTYAENELGVKKALFGALQGRFDLEYVTQIFIAIISTNIEDDPDVANQDEAMYQRALRWTFNELMADSTCLPELSLAFSLSSRPSLPESFSSVLKTSFANVNEETSCLVPYPIDGFMVLMRSAAFIKVDATLRKRAVFRRLLYLLTESVFNKSISSSTLMELMDGIVNRDDPDTMRSDSTASAVNDTSSHCRLTIHGLRGTALFDDRTYRQLMRLEDFRDLSENAAWTGPAVAAFLHGLKAVSAFKQTGDAWDLFNAVLNQHKLGGLSIRPEEFTVQECMSAIQSFA